MGTIISESKFKRITIAGGGTIAETISGYVEEPEWNVSSHIPNELYEAWAQHENVRLMYQHILGHRIFICENIRKELAKGSQLFTMLNEK